VIFRTKLRSAPLDVLKGAATPLAVNKDKRLASSQHPFRTDFAGFPARGCADEALSTTHEATFSIIYADLWNFGEKTAIFP